MLWFCCIRLLPLLQCPYRKGRKMVSKMRLLARGIYARYKRSPHTGGKNQNRCLVSSELDSQKLSRLWESTVQSCRPCCNANDLLPVCLNQRNSVSSDYDNLPTLWTNPLFQCNHCWRYRGKVKWQIILESLTPSLGQVHRIPRLNIAVSMR